MIRPLQRVGPGEYRSRDDRFLFLRYPPDPRWFTYERAQGENDAATELFWLDGDVTLRAAVARTEAEVSAGPEAT